MGVHAPTIHIQQYTTFSSYFGYSEYDHNSLFVTLSIDESSAGGRRHHPPKKATRRKKKNIVK